MMRLEISLGVHMCMCICSLIVLISTCYMCLLENVPTIHHRGSILFL